MTRLDRAIDRWHRKRHRRVRKLIRAAKYGIVSAESFACAATWEGCMKIATGLGFRITPTGWVCPQGLPATVWVDDAPVGREGE